MKLISMTDFVLQEANPSNTDTQFADKVCAYANFLKQPLTLGMFVPCDDNGNVLEEPYYFKDFEFNFFDNISNFDLIKCENYKKAQSKVLFNDFYLDETYKRENRQLPYLTNGKTSVFLHSDFAIRHQLIEDLIDSELDLAVSF